LVVKGRNAAQLKIIDIARQVLKEIDAKEAESLTQLQ